MRAMPVTQQIPTRRMLVTAWVVQIVQSLVLAAVVLVYVNQIGGAAGKGAKEWESYAIYGLLAAAIPAMLYVRWFKRILNQDEAAMNARGGEPEPGIRKTLRRALTLGGALCDLPMALGVLFLMFGGDKRYFIGGTLITLAVRLSYRPFVRSRAR
jgi:hypothetical protein